MPRKTVKPPLPLPAGYDFKRLFTISEYYDRDRSAFYAAIQNVRDQGMDLTGWLDYYVDGRAARMIEVTARGKRVIRRDAIANKYGLSDRQALAVGHLLENPILPTTSTHDGFGVFRGHMGHHGPVSYPPWLESLRDNPVAGHFGRGLTSNHTSWYSQIIIPFREIIDEYAEGRHHHAEGFNRYGG